MWQVGMGVLMVVGPLKVVVSILPTICGVFYMHSTYLWDSFESYDKITKGFKQINKKIYKSFNISPMKALSIDV
jgi:hypothetical protein